MKFPNGITQVRGQLSRLSTYRLALWTTIAIMLMVAATSSATWDVKSAAGAPSAQVGGTVPPDKSGCNIGALVALPDIVGTMTSNSVELLPLQNDRKVPPVNNRPDPKHNEVAASDSITLTSVATPTHGSVAWAKIDVTTTLTYTPDEGFTGSDVFTYTIVDDCSRTATGHVTAVVFRDDMPTQPAIITRPPTPGKGVQQRLTLPVSATLSIPAEIFGETDEYTDTHYFTVADLGNPQELLDKIPGPGKRFAGVAFRISEFRQNNEVANPTFQVPLILEIAFELAENENPQLFYWDEENEEWKNDGIELLSYDPDTGVATFAIHHLTDFAVFVETDDSQFLYLPNLRSMGAE